MLPADTDTITALPARIFMISITILTDCKMTFWHLNHHMEKR